MNKKELLKKLNDLLDCDAPCEACGCCDLDTECEDEVTECGETCIIRNLQLLIRNIESEGN